MDVDAFQDRMIPWDFADQPLTFHARLLGSSGTAAQKKRVALVVRLFSDSGVSLDSNGRAVSNDFLNCHLTGFCSEIYTCCYHFLKPKFWDRYQKACPEHQTCRAPFGTRTRTMPCEAVCFPQMVLNIALGENVVCTGGAV